ncbi:MAG: hypothetical protein EBZ78_08565, partial [Verrucomicrobia bacterium]|nr:hypothetical protein [Verrucomicrobiota bacterium]
LADAVNNGDGGRVILWSEEYTGFLGSISAQGGSVSGNGGFVETSSRDNLQAFGSVQASAPWGEAGLWLLDPANVEIAAGTLNGSFNSGTPNIFTPDNTGSATASATTIQTSLNGGTSVIIQTGISTAGQPGNITLTAGISKDATVAGTASTLTMIAAGSINISQPITSVDGALSLVLGAAAGVTVSSTISTLGGDITIQGANALGSALDTSTTTVAFNNGASISTLGGTGGGNLSITATGAITQNATSTLNIKGTTSVTTGNAAITLTQASNDFNGAVSLANTGGNAVAITDLNALTLGTLAVGGNLTVTSTGALNLGQGSVGGSLTATSNNNPISQSSPPGLSVTGLTTINAGTSSINLPGPGNAFTGGVLLSAGTITAFQNSVSTTLTPVGDITIGNITIPGGTLTVTAGGSITINGNINVTTGTILLSAGNATTSPASGQIILAGTPTITASRVGLVGYTIGIPTQPLLTIGGGVGGSITLAALASGGAASSNTDNRINSNSGIFITNQGVATIGTVVDVAGFVSTGQGGIIFENNNNVIISSGISSKQQ